MIRITNIKMDLEHTQEDLKNKVSKILRLKNNIDLNFIIRKKSIDARDKENIFYTYTIDIEIPNEKKYLKIKNVSPVSESSIAEYKTEIVSDYNKKSPVVVGFGPSGIFAGLILAEAGLKPVIIERGSEISKRQADVKNFFENKILNTESNVQFGEGGAGTFSDGKLTTNIKDFRIAKVIDEFVKAGAPDEIKYLSKPHIGTDNLVNILQKIRKKIIELGGEILFDTKLIDLNFENKKLNSITVQNENYTYEIETENVILALGHSARDTFEMLHNKKIFMTQKPFAVGMRIEHKQSLIDKTQYGKFYKKLPPAEYKLNHRCKNGKGVYTFCMCPGGVVVNASSEKNRLCVNGMSFFKRDSENSNSALLVEVGEKDFADNNPLSALDFQRKLEEKAFVLGGGNYNAPIQLLKDFINNKKSESLGEIKPSVTTGYTFANLRELFTSEMNDAFLEAIFEMDKKLKGFNCADAILTGVESRSSSPIRILRDENFYCNVSPDRCFFCEAKNTERVKGIIPCGEGAGYAGGIVSASVDGIKCAEMLIKNL